MRAHIHTNIHMYVYIYQYIGHIYFARIESYSPASVRFGFIEQQLKISANASGVVARFCLPPLALCNCGSRDGIRYFADIIGQYLPIQFN